MRGLETITTVQINEDELLARSFGVEGVTSTSLSGETNMNFSVKNELLFLKILLSCTRKSFSDLTGGSDHASKSG